MLSSSTITNRYFAAFVLIQYFRKMRNGEPKMMEFYHHRVEEKSQISGVPLSFANDQPGKYLNIKNSQ